MILPFEDRYSEDEVRCILNGYRALDKDGRLSTLMAEASQCRRCHARAHPGCTPPVNALVRPLPLQRLSDNVACRKYCIKIKRDDTYLRRQFEQGTSSKKVIASLGPTKFSIGLIPWADRCMLYQTNGRTKLMVVGIDYKNFHPFFNSPRDHQFPLDSYRKPNNIWGVSWRRFWRHLIGIADDESVNNFIARNGVFFTNSMLCFGGTTEPTHHDEDCLNNCQSYIAELISIIRPEVLVSFGVLGLRNVVWLLRKENPGHPFLNRLIEAEKPFEEMRKAVRREDRTQGIQVVWEGRRVIYWPLYQPARPKNRYPRDYETLRELLGIEGIET